MTNNEELPLCECGCGLRVTKLENRFIKGHNNNRLGTGKPKPEAQLCECGCGRLANPGYRFIRNHNWKGKTHTNKSKIKQSEAHLKSPLLIGEKNKIPINKNCASYLGSVAEQSLSKIFKNVKIMPNGNCGYDIICNMDKKIDIKSSATGYKGYWFFNISQNKIADYFLCIAFEDRENLNPVHLWLIPGEDINHLMGISIAKSTRHKWDKYEQPIDKVISCCNEMRGE